MHTKIRTKKQYELLNAALQQCKLAIVPHANYFTDLNDLVKCPPIDFVIEQLRIHGLWPGRLGNRSCSEQQDGTTLYDALAGTPVMHKLVRERRWTSHLYVLEQLVMLSWL